MSELRVTGGYEPNDPVVMSREEYHAALAQARREAFVMGCVQIARWENGETGAMAMQKPAEEEALRRWPKEGK